MRGYARKLDWKSGGVDKGNRRRLARVPAIGARDATLGSDNPPYILVGEEIDAAVPQE